MAAPRLRDSIIFVPWVLALFGWFLFMTGVAALQQNCGSSGINSLTRGAGAGFLAPIECKSFYSFTWWIVWYVFLVLLTLPILIVRDSVKKFRGGLLGLISLALVQLFSTANTYTFFNALHSIRGASLARARVVLAGTVTTSIGLFLVFFILAFRDEQNTELHEKRIGAPEAGPDATRGGVYESEPEAVTYTNPVAET